MTSTVTTMADADRVASMVADGLRQLLDAEFWKFPGDDLLHAARRVLPQDAISGEEIPPVLPELGAAIRAGDLGSEQTTVVVKTMSRIPTDVPVQIRGQAETTLVEHSRTMDPPHLSLVADKLLTALDPDGHFEPRNPADRAELAFGVRDATGVTVSPATARRLLCDCDVIPAVLGSAGEPLDIGRATRTWPTGIRRAVALRDGGCVFPACDRPARWADIHHISHWVDGGPTSLANAAVLSGHHHALTHQGAWQIRMAKDGRPEIIPLTWIDPAQQPPAPATTVRGREGSDAGEKLPATGRSERPGVVGRSDPPARASGGSAAGPVGPGVRPSGGPGSGIGGWTAAAPRLGHSTACASY